MSILGVEDYRGCIYVSEKNQGIFILRLKEIWPYAAM